MRRSELIHVAFVGMTQAARSEIFKAMLASDVCKAPPSAAISLPEFNRDQLQCFLQFLYQGTITEEDASKHVFSLFQAADKYDIPFLKSFCERQLLGALSAANALDILEVSAACGGEAVKRKAMETIVEHAEDVLFSSHYDRFAPNNAHLCVEITRMLLKGRLDKRASAACEASSQ